MARTEKRVTQPKTDNLMAIAERALDAAKKAGAEWCDVSVGRAQDVSVDVENGSIKSVDAVSSCGYSVRAVVKGAQGVFSATGFEDADVVNGAREAAEMAKAAESDPDFRALPPPSSPPQVDGLYDPRLAAMTPAEAVEVVVANVEDARKVDPGVILSGGIGFDASEGVFLSSTGVRLEKRSTSAQVSFFAIVKRGDDSGSFFEMDWGRMWRDLDPVWAGRAATEQALRFLGARKVATRRMAIVLGPLATFSFVRSLASCANAEGLQRKRSFLVGKRGARIASPLLHIVDDGLIAHGVFSGEHDGEGAERKRVAIFEDGVFSGVLHNSYTAGKAGEPNTGHGGRTGGIHPSNLALKLGDRTADDIIAGTDEGIYINMGSVAPDPASFGFKIEKGRLAYPVINTMVSGHVLEFLANLDAVSSDYREEPGNKLPSLRIRDVQVSGSE